MTFKNITYLFFFVYVGSASHHIKNAQPLTHVKTLALISDLGKHMTDVEDLIGTSFKVHSQLATGNVDNFVFDWLQLDLDHNSTADGELACQLGWKGSWSYCLLYDEPKAQMAARFALMKSWLQIMRRQEQIK